MIRNEWRVKRERRLRQLITDYGLRVTVSESFS